MSFTKFCPHYNSPTVNENLPNNLGVENLAAMKRNYDTLARPEINSMAPFAP
jgi:hypothetical protein